MQAEREINDMISLLKLKTEYPEFLDKIGESP